MYHWNDLDILEKSIVVICAYFSVIAIALGSVYGLLFFAFVAATVFVGALDGPDEEDE